MTKSDIIEKILGVVMFGVIPIIILVLIVTLSWVVRKNQDLHDEMLSLQSKIDDPEYGSFGGDEPAIVIKNVSSGNRSIKALTSYICAETKIKDIAVVYSDSGHDDLYNGVALDISGECFDAGVNLTLDTIKFWE